MFFHICPQVTCHSKIKALIHTSLKQDIMKTFIPYDGKFRQITFIYTPFRFSSFATSGVPFLNSVFVSLPVQVFSILTLQLLFTFSVVCVFTFSSVVKEAVQTNLWAYLSSFIVFAVVAIALSLCKSFSRRHPWNIVGLVGYKYKSIKTTNI